MKETLSQLQTQAENFLDERNWKQFHNPKTDSMNIAIEAAELMEIFLYDNLPENAFSTLEKKREHVEEEIGDILHALLTFAVIAKIDVAEAFKNKLAKTAAKYPAAQVMGRKEKYNEYHERKDK